MSPQGLVARTVGALVLAGLFPILVAEAVTPILSQGTKQVDQYLLLLASHAAESMRQGLEQSYTLVEAVAQDGVIAGSGEPASAKASRLELFNALFPRFRHLTLVDPEGRTLASSTSLYQGEWRGQGFFLLARAGQGAISPAHLSTGSPEPWLSFAAPVLDDGGHPQGVLVGEIPVATAGALTLSPLAGQVGEAFVVNSSGQVIAHPRSERLMQSWPLPTSGGRDGPWLAVVEEAGTHIYATAPVEISKLPEAWKVVIRIPASEAYAAYRQSRQMALLASLGVLLLSLLVAVVLGTAVSRPLQRVAAAARRMASGDLACRVSESTGGELGELAASFNTMAQELQAKVQDLRDSRRRMVTLQEGVRREIARQLHGSVQSKLLLAWYRLKEAQGRAALAPEEARRLLSEVEQELEQVNEDLRLASRRLYPSILRRGLAPALRSLADRFEAALTVEVEVEEGLTQREKAAPGLISEEVRLAAYRIAEEALTNVVKHAMATKVTLRLSQLSEERLCLVVKDDGRGFPSPAPNGGLGMASMKDQAEAVGGSCRLRSAPGEGSEVTAVLPLAGLRARHPE